MAVVLPSPRRLDPAKRGKYVERNSARVLARMQASGMLPEPEESYELAESTGAPDIGLSTAANFAVGVSTP